MHFVRAFPALLALFTAAKSLTCAAEESPTDDRAVENLAAFAQVYGYVRFFHPSDQASEVDWDKFGVIGAEAVREAADREALRAALLRVFQPIAPRLSLTDSASPTVAGEPPASLTEGGRLTYWQYGGINLSGQPSGIYRQQRVITGEKRGARAPLFLPATTPPPLTKLIAPGLELQLPLALPVDADGKTAASSPEFAALQAQLAGIDLKTLTPADWRLRVAGVVTVWNVFQHFHPYLDSIGVKWEAALRPALRRALRDADGSDYRETLAELVAKSRDGHGWVYGPPGPIGELPTRVALVEGKLVVTGIAAGAPFRKGDIIERLDGAPALDVLRERERYASGSSHLSEFRALNEFGEGAPDTIARLEILRDGMPVKIEVARTLSRQRRYFFNSICEFEFPAFAEVRPDIYYVNLQNLEPAEFEARLPQLAGARGVIFDERYDGRKAITRQTSQLHEAEDIIPHLIGQRIQASPMLTPRISLPDRAGWTFLESTWPVQPKAPRYKGLIVFINEPSVVSYGETCMAMIADYHLATLVGAPTAGCNGNANFIPLPGGFNVMWTGMDVRKHDRSPFYTVGFVPDYPVARTLRAVKEGRDEYLEKAIEVIERQARPAEPAAKQG
jgi:hypothetical protein